MINRRSDDGDEIKKRVVEVQKDFIYIEIAKNHWLCKSSTSTIFCFEIIVGKYGIYVGGDMDSLSFRVGESYGLEFLAGNDVDVYIKSKLEHAYLDQIEFDEKALDEWLEYVKDCYIDDELKLAQLEEFKENLKFAEGLHEIYDVIYRSPFYDGEMPINTFKTSQIFYITFR